MSVIVFDSNKKFIKVTAPGPQGPKGDPAPNVLIQFSPDNANWHTDYQQGDAYVRFSNDNGVTWTNGVPVAVNADTLDGYHASDFQAMIDKKVDEFIIPKNGDTVVWHKVGELTTDIRTRANNLTLLVSGVSDLGWNKPGVDVVQVSTRGGVSVDVYSLTTPGFRSQTYGYVNNTSTGKTEIWVKRNIYTYETHFAVLNAYDATYGNLASSSTEPSGIVYVDIKTHWTSGNDGSGSGLDADMLDGYHASQTPTANSIPVADTNNKIDDGWLSTIPACMVRLSADQALVANTYSKIQFDTVDYDILSNFDNANYHFTVPQSGLYQIAAIVNFYVSDATSTVRTIRVYVNDVAANGMAQQTSTGDAHTTVSLSAILSLNAGDTVSIYGCSDAINDNIVGLEYSSLYICRIR